MSLKFGVYLVEQRIVTPEQFCGLVKIQQESVRSLAKISLERNMLTIRQVANVLDAQEKGSNKPFHQLAIEMNYLSTTDGQILLQAQESSGVSINDLLVECGVLTENQSRVLYSHFQRTAFRSIQSTGKNSPQTQRDTTAKPTPAKPSSTGPRQPNFKRRPVIIQNRQVQI